jgi:hypothetical protein
VTLAFHINGLNEITYWVLRWSGNASFWGRRSCEIGSWKGCGLVSICKVVSEQESVSSMGVEYLGGTNVDGLVRLGKAWAVVPNRQWVFNSRERAEEVAALGEDLCVIPVIPNLIIPHKKDDEPVLPLCFLRRFWIVVPKANPVGRTADLDGSELYTSREQAEEVRDQGNDLTVHEIVLLVPP